MNKKIRTITQTGLVVKMMNEKLDESVIYKVRGDYNAMYSVPTSKSTVDDYKTELEARMAA